MRQPSVLTPDFTALRWVSADYSLAPCLNMETGGGRVRGQVASAFGVASTHLHNLRGLYAQELASRHVDYFRMVNSTGNGSTPFLELVTADSRSPPGLCGDTGADADCRSINTQTNDVHDQYILFNHAHSGQGLFQA